MRFFDTNILIYAASYQDMRKKKIAMEILNHALEVNRDGAISSQVISEFCAQMLGKLKMPRSVVDEFVTVFLPLQSCDVTYDLVRHALKIRENSEWYYANLAALLPKYEGRYVAVANRSLFGDYGECADGVRAVESAGFPRGTFIVHKCVPLEQERREWYFRTNRIFRRVA